MSDLFWLTEAQMARLAPLLPQDTRGTPRDQRHRSRLAFWRAVGGCAGGLRTAQDAVQPVRALGSQGCVGARVSCARSCRRPTGRVAARQQPREGTSQRRGRKRGEHAQAIGRSRGGRTSKIHALTDHLGRPIGFELTAGQRGDAPVALALLAPWPSARLCIADAAYDSNGIRSFLLARGTVPVIPNNPTRKQHHPFDRSAYRKRNLIERAFCRLKDFRRIATRYDRRADVFLSAVYLAAIVTWWI